MFALDSLHGFHMMFAHHSSFMLVENQEQRAYRRYRGKYLDCYIEVDQDDRRRNQPKYLYHAGDVLPYLQKLRDRR